MPTLIQKRFTNMMKWMDKYQGTYNKNHIVIEEHEQLDKWLHEKILELQNRDERQPSDIQNCEDLIKAHKEYLEELREEGATFLDGKMDNIPSLLNNNGEQNEKVGQTCDCQHILQSALKAAKDQDAEKVVDFIESILLMEVEA